jgi:hypothetical protein
MISAVLGYGVSRLINQHPLYESLSAGFLKETSPRIREMQGEED